MKSLFVLCVFALSTMAFAENKITVLVGLSPAGSFQAVSQKAKGDLFKQGESFSADKISVSIESFKTGIDLRDEHFWKHLNSSKHPKATLTDLKASAGKATANLELNGVKKPITISYQVVGQEVSAKFTAKASDYALKKAEYLGVGVEDLVNIEVSIPFKTK